MDTTIDFNTPPANPAEIVARFKAVAKENADNKAAIERAVADFGQKLRVNEQAIALAKMREVTPTGTGDFSKYVGTKGAILKSAKDTVTFAGQQVTVEREGLFTDRPENEWHHELIRLGATRSVARAVRGIGNTPELDARILAHVAKAPTAGGFRDAIEKSISDTASSGAEWIPDVPLNALYEEFYLKTAVSDLFSVTQIPGPVIIPTIVDNGRPYLKGKASSNDPSQYTASELTSGSNTIDPPGFAMRFLIDDSAAESAIFALMPEVARRAARAINDGYEDACINGDTTATHEDTIASWNIRSRWGSSGLGGAADHRRGFKGLRRISVDRSSTTDMGSTQTTAGILTLVSSMGEIGAARVALVTSPEVYLKKLLALAEVITVDKMGPMATVLTGQLANFAGHPLIVTRWVGADLAATGLYTATGALSGMLAVATDQFGTWRVRSTTVEQDKDITRGAYNVVATSRQGLYTQSSSTSKVVAWGYNWLS